MSESRSYHVLQEIFAGVLSKTPGEVNWGVSQLQKCFPHLWWWIKGKSRIKFLFSHWDFIKKCDDKIEYFLWWCTVYLWAGVSPPSHQTLGWRRGLIAPFMPSPVRPPRSDITGVLLQVIDRSRGFLEDPSEGSRS